MSSLSRRFEACRDADPTWAEAWNKLATVKYLCRQFVDSIVDCEKAYELQEFHFGAISGLGLNYLGLRQTGMAIKYFKKALEVHPGSFYIGFLGGDLHFGLDTKKSQIPLFLQL